MNKLKVNVGKDEILNSIIRQTSPIGETNYDKVALENIQDLITFVDKGIDQLEFVCNMQNHTEQSIQDCVKIAKNYMLNLKDYFNENSIYDDKS